MKNRVRHKSGSIHLGLEGSEILLYKQGLGRLQELLETLAV